MQAFWARGYEATSVNDLMDATGLQKGSLYKAFGDKHSLFIKALGAYLDELSEHDQALAAQDVTPKEALQAYVHGGIDSMTGEGTDQCGCFAVNTVVELAPHDPEVRALLMKDYQLKLDAMSRLIKRGQDAGDFRTCLLYTSPSPRDRTRSRMPSSA